MYFNGQLYQNNSVIDALAIDNGIDSLYIDALVCVTNQFPCCSRLVDGSWYNPDGSQLPENFVSAKFFQKYSPRRSVVLYRSVASPSSSEGLFHCQITDRTNATVYIGIYRNGTGKKFSMLHRELKWLFQQVLH